MDIKEILKSAFSDDNIGLTIGFIIILGPLAYIILPIVFSSLAVLIATIAIGIGCFVGGFLLGIEVEKK